MTDLRETVRPVPRWLHILAILTAIATIGLLTLGGLVTTFRAGMSDPVWPTEPWYLFFIDWQEPSPGFLIEHSHRLAGFFIGGLSIVLSIGLWITTPHKTSRWAGLIGIIVLLGSYGMLHKSLMQSQKEMLDAQRSFKAKASDSGIEVKPHVDVPMGILAAMGSSLLLVAALGVAGLMLGEPGSGTRLLGLILLAAVMVQGLLGGLRVLLNALVGPELAIIHGVFAQIVFCLMIAMCTLTARRRVWDGEAWTAMSGLVWPALLLMGFAFMQLVWGAMLRHQPSPLWQRLHLLSAFIVVGASVWMVRTVWTSPEGRRRVGAAAWVLIAILILQVSLGVEAWLGKFGTRRPVEIEEVLTASRQDRMKAMVRTAHLVVGSGLLATAVSIFVRLWISRVGSSRSSPAPSGEYWHDAKQPVLAGATTIHMREGTSC